MIIGISGTSGVGKSTLAEIVSLYFGIQNTTIISTDDLHKWERGNDVWKNITHLNPEANNLDLGDIHLNNLKCGIPIYRSKYNHKTGTFDPPVKITPQKIIVVEGLHAFYSQISKQLIDIKIFVTVNDSLKKHWKIIRDINERGYSQIDVLDAINRRANDEKIIEQQADVADAVVNINADHEIIVGDASEKINPIFSIVFEKNQTDNNKQLEIHNLLIFIQNYMNEMNTFLDMCENIGKDTELFQGTGGNVSMKLNDRYMIIKSSGCKIKDMRHNGYSIVNKIIKTHICNSCISSKYKRPSMEGGFHALLNSKYVIHAHPVYLLVLLCLFNSKQIIQQLFASCDYLYINYITPGTDLLQYIKDKEAIFLENHGVIVQSNDLTLGIKKIYNINETAKNYIKQYTIFSNFTGADTEYTCDPVFPDAVIFTDKEVVSTNNYIVNCAKKLGIVRYLTESQKMMLKTSEPEQYRHIQ